METTKPTKVVVKYLNGKLIKRFMQNFSPNKDSFYLIPADKTSGGSIEVLVSHLKAIFVVRGYEPKTNLYQKPSIHVSRVRTEYSTKIFSLICE